VSGTASGGRGREAKEYLPAFAWDSRATLTNVTVSASKDAAGTSRIKL
jgi:hypothetical protein